LQARDIRVLASSLAIERRVEQIDVTLQNAIERKVRFRPLSVFDRQRVSQAFVAR
jgi:hypothetical protein